MLGLNRMTRFFLPLVVATCFVVAVLAGPIPPDNKVKLVEGYIQGYTDREVSVRYLIHHHR